HAADPRHRQPGSPGREPRRRGGRTARGGRGRPRPAGGRPAPAGGRVSAARATVERFLKAVVSPAPGDMADCYANQVVIEMPFASGLAPARTETTREELRRRFAAGAASRRYTGLRDVCVHETADPDVVILEYTHTSRSPVYRRDAAPA